MATYKRNFLLVLTLILLSGNTLFAQAGKTFWFVAPDVTSSHGEAPIALRITAGANPAKVVISQPANAGFVPITVNVPANSQVSVRSDITASFSLASVENSPINTVNNHGLLVTSDQDVTVYYEVLNGNNPDIFTLKGENALGMDFYVPSQNVYSNHDYSSGTQPYEQINIVATENNTQVTITPKEDLLPNIPKGVPFTITLNKGQSYSMNAKDWSTANMSLAGTHITSDKNIAVTISDDSIDEKLSGGSAWDLIGDQLVPVSVIGTEYIALNTSFGMGIPNTVNKVFIVATADNTVVKIDGLPNVVLNKGESIVGGVDISSNAMHVSSNYPVYVYQLSGLPQSGNSNNELGSALLPPVSGCTGSKRVSFTRNFSNAYMVQIMTKLASIPSFTMYNKTGNVDPGTATIQNAANWKQVGTSVWYTLNVDMSKAPFGTTGISTGDPYSIENTVGLFHLSVLDMNGSSLSYGYYSSYNTIKIAGATQQCVGNAIELSTADPLGTYSWTATATGAKVLSTAPKFNVTASDTYFLNKTDAYGCQGTDKIVVVFKHPVISLPVPGTLCGGQDVVFTLPTTYNYVWSTKETTNSITVKAVNGTSTVISVVATDPTDPLHCTSTATSTVVAFNDPVVDMISVPSTVCVGETIRVVGAQQNYVWKLNGVQIQSGPLDYVIATTSGTYEVTGTSANGCSSTTSKNITVNALPAVSISQTNPCEGVANVLTALPAGLTYVWNNTATLNGSTLSVTNTNPVTLTAMSSQGCKATTLPFIPTFKPVPTVALQYTSNLVPIPADALQNISTCVENKIDLSAVAGGAISSYNWSVSGVPSSGPALTAMSVTAVANVTTPVIVVVTAANGCTATDNVNIIAYAAPTVSTAKAEYCVGEIVTETSSLSNYQWELNNVIVAGATSNTYIPTASGTLKLRGWNANSCVSVDKVMTINPLPVPGVSGSPVCANDPYIFTGSPAAGVTYLWNQVSTPLAAKSYSSSTFSVTSPNDVTLKVTDAKGCSATTLPATPSWRTLPSADISYVNSISGQTLSSDNIDLCPQASISLIGTASSNPVGVGIQSYSWTNDNPVAPDLGVAFTPTYSFNVPASGVVHVTLTVTDNKGCTKTDNVTITVLVPPVASINKLNDKICLTNTLTAEPIRAEIDHLQWTDPSNAVVAGNPYTFTPVVGGTYKLQIWNSSGCTATRSFSVSDPAFNVNQNVVEVCAGGSYPFAVVSPVPDYKYTWKNSSTGDTVKVDPSFTATIVGNYTVQGVHNTLGCRATQPITFTMAPSKILNVGPNVKICATANDVELTADNTLFSGFRWYFSPGAAAPTYVSIPLTDDSPTYTLLKAQPGWYKVTADYTPGGIPSGCAPISQVFYFDVLNVLDPLTIVSDECSLGSGTVCICEKGFVNLKADNGFKSYRWYQQNPANSGIYDPTAIANTQLLKVLGSTSNTYKLEALQSNGCMASAVVPVFITPLPSVTLSVPNGGFCEGSTTAIQNNDDVGGLNYTYGV